MKRILTLILTLTLILSAFTGCTPQNPDTGDGSDKVTNPVINLNSFESYDDLHRVVYGSLTGRMDLSTDKKMTGEQSLKVTVVAKPYITTTSGGSLRQSLTNDKTGESYNDFEKVSLVTVDIYNANDEICRVGFNLNYPSGNEVTEYYELAPNQWTKVRYTVNREYIPVVTEGRDKIQSRKVNYLQLYFDRGEEDRVFYIDDFNLYRTSKEVQVSDMTRAEGEIASFDKLWQVKKVGKVSYSSPAVYMDTEWAMLPDYTEKGGLLKVQAGNKQKRTWSYIKIGPTLVDGFDFTGYDGNDELRFEVFVPEVGGWDSFHMEFFAYGVKLGKTQTKTLTQGWNEISFTVDEINTNENGVKNEGTYSFSNLDFFYISTLTSTDGDKILYLDNFRMIKMP